MIPVSRDKILHCFAGIPAVLCVMQHFIDYILRLHVKRFILARRDPSLYSRDPTLPGRNFPMSCYRISPPRPDKKII